MSIPRGNRKSPKKRLPIVQFLRALSILPIICGAFYVLFFLPTPPAVSIVSATVESVSFEATDPELAQLPLRGYNIFVEAGELSNMGFNGRDIKSESARKPICYDGVIVPSPGTKVTYRRFADNPVEVTFERTDGKPAATFERGSSETPESLKNSSWIRLDGVDPGSKASTGCEGTATPRLPVFGIGDIGSEIKPAAQGEEPSYGALISGTLDVLAHTIELRAIQNDFRNLYSTNSRITLPPGSRLTQRLDPAETQYPWIGFALVGNAALDLHVTSDARRIAIIRPGIGLKPEIISVGLFTQLSNDPTLTSAQVIMALFFAMMQFLGSVFSWYEVRKIAELESELDGNPRPLSRD